MRFSLYAAILATAYAAPALAQTASTVSSTDVSVGSSIALTFYLAPKHAAAAESKAQSLQTPGSPDYHRFLTVKQFVDRYAPSTAELKSIEDSLQNIGFTIGYVYPNHLAIEVTATVATAQNALGVKLKHFEADGRSGFASVTPVTLPLELRDSVRGVGGLNTMTRRHPMHSVKSFGLAAAPTPQAGTLVGGTPGNYLPADFAKFYHVQPLYDFGISGRGATIGIITLNTFDPADAYSFWKQIGLTVSPTRITRVNVDGGETASSNNPNGEGETDLDTEYSGALAPNANLRVYIAPNITEANYINAFEAAASENIADTVSTSWGEPELDFFYDVATQTPGNTALLEVYHDAFLEMALQGQTLYAASGDSGAFDTVRGCPAFGTPSPKTPVCNAPYAVDHPSSDPLITAAGGTTRPFSAKLRDGITLSVDKERAWSWDYISSEAAAQGFGTAITLADVFAVGDGGGVSSFWPTPWYQTGVPGITKTKPGQTFAANFGSGSVVQTILPANFAGRNTPDLSANADPFSGYQYLQGGVVYGGNGGTSFVAPQLNGVTALYVEFLGQRVGQINPAFYQLGNFVSSDIRTGDNWGYLAGPHYDNATGFGTLNATNLLVGLFTLQFVY